MSDDAVTERDDWLPDLEPPPDGWVALDVIAVVKGLDEEGRVIYWTATSDDLQQIEALGMLRAAMLSQEHQIATWFDGDDDDDD